MALKSLKITKRNFIDPQTIFMELTGVCGTERKRKVDVMIGVV